MSLMAVPVLVVRCDLASPTSSLSCTRLTLATATESTNERPGIVAQTAPAVGPGSDWRPRGRLGRQRKASPATPCTRLAAAPSSSPPSTSPACARRDEDRAVRHLCPHGHAPLNGRPFRSGLRHGQPLMHPACYPPTTFPRAQTDGP